MVDRPVEQGLHSRWHASLLELQPLVEEVLVSEPGGPAHAVQALLAHELGHVHDNLKRRGSVADVLHHLDVSEYPIEVDVGLLELGVVRLHQTAHPNWGVHGDFDTLH